MDRTDDSEVVEIADLFTLMKMGATIDIDMLSYRIGKGLRIFSREVSANIDRKNRMQEMLHGR